jgi:hypothetical protein
MKLLLSPPLAAAVLVVTASVHARPPTEMLQGYSAQAGAAAQPERGRQFFDARHGRKWSCSSCHGAVPTQPRRHAATGRPIGALAPPEDRITRSAWFIRKHDEVPAAAWQRPAIRSAANCGACHPKADQGDLLRQKNLWAS